MSTTDSTTVDAVWTLLASKAFYLGGTDTGMLVKQLAAVGIVIKSAKLVKILRAAGLAEQSGWNRSIAWTIPGPVANRGE